MSPLSSEGNSCKSRAGFRSAGVSPALFSWVEGQGFSPANKTIGAAPSSALPHPQHVVGLGLPTNWHHVDQLCSRAAALEVSLFESAIDIGDLVDVRDAELAPIIFRPAIEANR